IVPYAARYVEKMPPLEDGATKWRYKLLLAGSGTGEEFVHADDLAVQGSGDERLAVNVAGFRLGDGHVVDFECFANRAFVIGPGFDEIGKRAEFRALCGNVIARSEERRVGKECKSGRVRKS